MREITTWGEPVRAVVNIHSECPPAVGDEYHPEVCSINHCESCWVGWLRQNKERLL